MIIRFFFRFVLAMGTFLSKTIWCAFRYLLVSMFHSLMIAIFYFISTVITYILFNDWLVFRNHISVQNTDSISDLDHSR